MVPNFIWIAIPAPNDILRTESKTQVIDLIATISQVLFVAGCCCVINKKNTKIKLSPIIIAMILCVVLYFIGWGLYYLGFVSDFIIVLLTLPPCLAFVFFTIDRKNVIALLPAIIFTCCHLIYGVVNFII